MENNTTDFQQQRPTRRPVFLTVLCILSFVYLGFSAIGILISLMVGKMNASIMERSNVTYIQLANQLRRQGSPWLAENMEQISSMALYMNENHSLSLLLNVVTFSAGLSGALLMFGGRKLGFHLYVIYNLFSVFGVYLIVPSDLVPQVMIIINGILAAIFVFLYTRNLYWLK